MSAPPELSILLTDPFVDPFVPAESLLAFFQDRRGERQSFRELCAEENVSRQGKGGVGFDAATGPSPGQLREPVLHRLFRLQKPPRIRRLTHSQFQEVPREIPDVQR